MCEPFAVGGLASLPNPFEPDHPAYESAAIIYAAPGRIVSVEDGWAIVDLGRWGQFGRPVGDLLSPRFACPDCRRLSHHPQDVEARYCPACHWWTGDPLLAGRRPDQRVGSG